VIDNNYNKECWAGVDYSMSCPALSIIDKDGNPISWYYLTQDKRYVGTFDDNINGALVGGKHDFKTDIDRYDFISSYFIEVLSKYKKLQRLQLEGYSMGSRGGLIFNIAENTGILKYKLKLAKIEYDIPSPKTIKKFAADNGNANKDMMFESFNKKFNNSIDIMKNIGYTKSTIGNPISDIVDSYYLATYGLPQ